MSIWGSIIGAPLAKPIEAVGGVLDKLFTSDEERLDKKAILARLAQRPAEAQVELNKLEAQHRTLFVAGWRPFIGWVLGLGFAFIIIVNPLIGWFAHRAGPHVPEYLIKDALFAMLGMGTLRTFEKIKGKTR